MADGSRTFPQGNSVVGWRGLLVPSIGDLIFVALLALLVVTPLSVRLLGDAGIGWHIRTGQGILANRAIPYVDLFSSTMNGKPWFAWEWFYDAIVGGLEGVAGLNAVVLFTALIIAVVFAWTFRLLVRDRTNVFVALVFVLLAASASMIHFLARPHVMSWLLTLAWFYILVVSEREKLRFLWLLPILMLLWVNVHGSFLLGFVLLGIFWIAALWARFGSASSRLEDILQRRRAGKQARDLALVGLLAALATFANPYGFHLHAHVYRYLSNRFLMDHIDEFQSPNFHGVAQKCFAILLLIAFLASASKVRKLRVSEGVVVLFAVYAGLYATRNVPVASLLIVLVTGPLLSAAIEKLPERSGISAYLREISAGFVTFSNRMREIESSVRGHLWPIAAVLLFCGIAANGGKLGPAQLMNAHFDAKRFPTAAVNFLKQSSDHTPVLVPDYWGGYLIYRLSPQTLVAFDDRHDLYGEEFLKSYLKMVHLEPGWDDFLRTYNIRRVLMPKNSPLANMLAQSSGWKVEYADDAAILFERSDHSSF